jgi:hypothetical protein
MAVVVNATQEKVTLVLQGNYFTWEPGKEKVIRNPELVKFIQTNKNDYGLAILPDLIEDDEDVSPEEFERRKAEHAEQRALECDQALDRYIKRLRNVIYNNQVSLRRDLEQKNIKADPSSYASDGELEAMRLVAKYQKRAEDSEASKIAEVKKLMEQVNKGK